MKTVLRRGDCVQIGTSDDAKPGKDWIGHVLTYKAKRNLRNFFSNVKPLKYKRCPHCHPLPGDEIIGFKATDGTITIHKRNCPVAIREASEQGDSIVSLNFENDSSYLFPVRIKARGVDRDHLLIDVVSCITEKMNLSINRLLTTTTDNIVETSIDFAVHSIDELHQVMDSIGHIRNVDEVSREDIE